MPDMNERMNAAEQRLALHERAMIEGGLMPEPVVVTPLKPGLDLTVAIIGNQGRELADQYDLIYEDQVHPHMPDDNPHLPKEVREGIGDIIVAIPMDRAYSAGRWWGLQMVVRQHGPNGRAYVDELSVPGLHATSAAGSYWLAGDSRPEESELALKSYLFHCGMAAGASEANGCVVGIGTDCDVVNVPSYDETADRVKSAFRFREKIAERLGDNPWPPFQLLWCYNNRGNAAIETAVARKWESASDINRAAYNCQIRYAFRPMVELKLDPMTEFNILYNAIRGPKQMQLWGTNEDYDRASLLMKHISEKYELVR